MTGYKGMKRRSPVVPELEATAARHGLTLAAYLAAALNRAPSVEAAAALLMPPLHPNTLRKWLERNPDKIRLRPAQWEALE